MNYSALHAPELQDALGFLSEDEKTEFFRWATAEESHASVATHMWFGHVYYQFALRNDALTADFRIDEINVAHRDTIMGFIAEGAVHGRALRDELLFFQIPNPGAQAEKFLIAVTLAGLGAFCNARCAGDALTQAELRTLAQVLTGAELRQAAQDDGVSYETKRSQVKALMAKLGFKRQIDLVADLLSALLLELMSHATSASDGAKPAIDHYLQRFAPRQTRLCHMQGPGGDTIPILDMGPATGVPLVSLQSSFLPGVGDDFVATLHRSDIRLIVPIRYGTLDPDSRLLTYDKSMDRALDGVAAAIAMTGAPRCAIHAAGPTARIAIECANRMPGKVSHLILQSVLRDSKAPFFSSPSLAASLTALAARNPLTAKLICGFLHRKLGQTSALDQMITRAFRENDVDTAMITRDLADPVEHERLRFAVSQSAHAILHDFMLIADPQWRKAAGAGVPMTFIHGADDQICALPDVTALAASLPDTQLRVIEGLQRYPTDAQRREVTTIIRDVLAQAA